MKAWLVWTAGFLSFPLAGILGGLAVGRVDGVVPALVGGLVTGAVIGTGQWLASLRRLPVGWIPASAVGMSAGLALGGAVVGFGTSGPELALMGALTGVVLGPAQALVLPAAWPGRALWAAALPALWALGWSVTTVIGVDVERQYTVFGSSGAITVSALLGLLLHLVHTRTSDLQEVTS